MHSPSVLAHCIFSVLNCKEPEGCELSHFPSWSSDTSVWLCLGGVCFQWTSGCCYRIQTYNGYSTNWNLLLQLIWKLHVSVVHWPGVSSFLFSNRTFKITIDFFCHTSHCLNTDAIRRKLCKQIKACVGKREISPSHFT